MSTLNPFCCSLFSLTKAHGHAEDGLPFHLCDNVLHIMTTQFAAPFFLVVFWLVGCFLFVYDEVYSFPLSWQAILSSLLTRLISLLSVLAGSEAWAGLLTSVTHKLERCSEPCPGSASICSMFTLFDEAQHCQLMFWLWWHTKPQSKTN